MQRKRVALLVFVTFGVLMAVLAIAGASGTVIALTAVIGSGIVAVVAIVTRDHSAR